MPSGYGVTLFTSVALHPTGTLQLLPGAQGPVLKVSVVPSGFERTRRRTITGFALGPDAPTIGCERVNVTVFHSLLFPFSTTVDTVATGAETAGSKVPRCVLSSITYGVGLFARPVDEKWSWIW